MSATTWILVLTSLTWLVWDIYLYWLRRNDKSINTISMIFTSFSWYSPALPFVAGVLCGHWFWPA